MYGHIYYSIARPASTLLQAYNDVSTATLSDAMGRHGAISSDIRPIFENIRMVGSLLTVLCFPGDNVMTHKALTMIEPGDILVIDDGDYNTGCFGHKSALHARLRGLAVTSKTRNPTMPDLPAVSEFPGLENFEADLWYGLLRRQIRTRQS
jgi:4-hydroxy-4-methyl-2-oxoglutarate aldolase